MTSANSLTIPAPEKVDSSALECLVIVGAMNGLQFTVQQLVQDNALESADIDYPKLVHCARNAGLKAKALRLEWDDLARLHKSLPVIVRLKSGASLVLVAMNSTHEETPFSV